MYDFKIHIERQKKYTYLIGITNSINYGSAVRLNVIMAQMQVLIQKMCSEKKLLKCPGNKITIIWYFNLNFSGVLLERQKQIQ